MKLKKNNLADVNVSYWDFDTVWKHLYEGCADFLISFQYLNILMMLCQTLSKRYTTSWAVLSCSQTN